MKGYEKQELCLIWLDSFEGLEYKHKQTLISLAEDKLDAKLIVEKGKDYILTSLNQNVYSTLKNSLTVEYIEYVLAELERRGIKAITINSKDYPSALKESPIPPLVLYAKGNIDLLIEQNLFTIVGSRKSLPLSINIAKDYVKTLAQNGITLVTGIAQGIDQTVIEETLIQNGKVISVVTGGLDNVYPKTNQKLVDKMVQNGCLVISEHPPQTKSLPYMFPIRNRILAGLSKGVLVVSAPKKSGTLWTADYANEYGKEVFAIPYSIGISSGEGCNNLIKQGATLTDSPKDILDCFNIEQRKEQEIELSEEERQIITLLSQGEKHIEQIGASLNKRAFQISPTLSILEIKGLIIKSGNLYQLTRNYSED